MGAHTHTKQKNTKLRYKEDQLGGEGQIKPCEIKKKAPKIPKINL